MLRFSTDLCLRKPSCLSELRRKQTTAVILMGVIGAEFGQEVSMTDNFNTSSRLQSDCSARRKSSIVEGFGIGNNNLSRLTSKIHFDKNILLYYFLCILKIQLNCLMLIHLCRFGVNSIAPESNFV